MGRSDKLVKNISFIVIGNIGSKLMGFFMLPFYTNWLSPADYGTTDLLIVYANLLLNVVACDMSDAIYYIRSRDYAEIMLSIVVTYYRSRSATSLSH